MGHGKPPGHECATQHRHPIDAGTNCLQPSPPPHSLGAWLGDAGDRALGHGKSLLISIFDLLPVKPDSPVSTALLKHYVERSGTLYTLGEIPLAWQDWIVTASGGRAGLHRELNPYNSGLFDLRNSLGHFDVEVRPAPGGRKTYVISDLYHFGFRKNDRLRQGRHGFPIGAATGWKLEAIRKLLPRDEYWNPGGFSERWEIGKVGTETILYIPQQFLARHGKPFPVTGSFER